MWLRGAVVLAALLSAAPVLAAEVWVALSGREAAYLEAAETLRANLPNHAVRIGDWGEFKYRVPAPDILVSVGSEALRQLRPIAEQAPILSVLVPRSALDELRDRAPGRISGVYYEQPFARQAALLRAAFPGKTRIGIVLGPATARYRGELNSALRRVGLQGVFEVAEDPGALAKAVQTVLNSAEMFLTLPDAEAINSQNAKFILLASYRRGMPVVGYSAAFVRAGAALAMVSSPSQNGREAARMVIETLAGNRLPAPRAPDDFEVLVNANVSRSLHLGLQADELERQVRAEGGY